MRPGARTLLCEFCGYPLDARDASGASSPSIEEARCPECGRAVHDSLPERRVGSPFQREPGVRSWLATFAWLARRPRSAWGEMRIEPRRSSMLLGVNLVFASGLLAGSIALGGPIEPRVHWWYPPIFFAVLALVLLGLTALEMTGLQLIGLRRKWRVSRTVAWAVVAHASVGWVVSGALAAVTWQVVQRVQWFWSPAPFMMIPQIPSGGPWRAIVAVLAAGVPGFLVFETLAYFGLLRCRFANR